MYKPDPLNHVAKISLNIKFKHSLMIYERCKENTTWLLQNILLTGQLILRSHTQTHTHIIDKSFDTSNNKLLLWSILPILKTKRSVFSTDRLIMQSPWKLQSLHFHCKVTLQLVPWYDNTQKGLFYLIHSEVLIASQYKPQKYSMVLTPFCNTLHRSTILCPGYKLMKLEATRQSQ
jgi:hypothetical protein